jgi:hypothetical protein
MGLTPVTVTLPVAGSAWTRLTPGNLPTSARTWSAQSGLVAHGAAPLELRVDEVPAFGGERQRHGEFAGPAGGFRVDVREGTQVVARGDEVHPRLVAAPDVVDRTAGRGVRHPDADGGGPTGGDVSRHLKDNLHPRVMGLLRLAVGGHHDAHRRTHRHSRALHPGEDAVHATLSGVGAAQRGQPGADAYREHGDAGQVGVVGDCETQRARPTRGHGSGSHRILSIN